jgi:hypothetical protein
MGTVAGPVGTAVGAVVGAVAGGLVGKGVAEGVNPSVEHDYWRKNFSSRPYASASNSYDEFAPAYQYGWESRANNPDKDFDEVQGTLANDWDRARGKSQLKWDTARQAVRDAWDRIDSSHKT